MKAERFEQVDRILQAALEREGAEREAFLDEACAGDTVLRSEVESLISSDGEAGSFIETPAFEVAAEMMASEQSKIVAGQTIGPYQIASSLGSGGMGDVYLAHDSRLDRKVALKLLPEYFTRDEERLRRFQQEARAVSALNHPNIITIFEIGKAESIHFIATEYITGQTLRKRMAGKTINLTEALEIAIQVAGALASAHMAGIVHRDIKPENIMLRDDGYVKVLDFGLAKLAEGQLSETKAPTNVNVNTNPGVVMGTASYMSPEQARGHEVDRRTDIFSLGVVVYEMVTDRLPFEAETTSDLIAAILKQEPAPLARYSREVPEGLEWIVTKTLAKDRDERYQTAREMLFDLKRLKQRMDYEAESQRSVTPDSNKQGVTTSSESIASKTDRERIIDTSTSVARKTSSAEYLISEIKRHKPGALLALVIFIIAAAGIGTGLYKLIGHNKPSTPFETVNIRNLTTTGHVTHAAISPDGKYVAHVVEDQGKESLWVRQVATTSSQQVVTSAYERYLGLTFSSDGDFIYYTVRENDKPLEGALYQVPVLASATPPRRLLTNIDTPITVSPDGKQFAYGVTNTVARESALMIANADGSGAYALVTKKGPQFIDFPWRFSSPAWSPNGKVIAYGLRIKSQPGGVGPQGVMEVSVKDGSEKPITSHRWLQVGRLAWLQDGSGLIITAAERLDLFQLWHLSLPGGEARRITNDWSKNYRGLSLTADASLIAATQQDEHSSIWIAPDGDTSRAQQITRGRYEGRYGVAWTPDGRIVYHSLASGNEDIWIMNADGSSQSQLTFDPGADDNCCEVSPDGRYIVFRSQRGDGPTLWRMDRDGGNAKQLTSHGQQPTVSPDGRWVIFHRGGRLWKVSIDGGEAAQLNTTGGDVGYNAPAISPDGKLIACLYRDDPNFGPRLAVIPSEGGQPIKLFETLPLVIRPLRTLHWTPDGQAIAYLNTTEGVSNIWSQPLNSDSPKPLTDFKSDSMYSFAWSRDGKLVYARGLVTSDVVLIRDSKR